MNDYSLLESDLLKCNIQMKINESLAKYTTIGIGGKARFFLEVFDHSQLESAIQVATQQNIPYRVIGKGSNILVSDKGYDGMIILNNTGNWQIFKKGPAGKANKIKSRFKPLGSLDFSEQKPALSETGHMENQVVVRADSGIRINRLINLLFNNNITGLQWFAGIPGTIGGAIYMNIHGGDYYFGDFIINAYITDGQNSREVSHEYFKFDYDWSVLHQTGETILYADLLLEQGNVKEAKAVAKEWMRYKSKQPQRSAGCIFQNLSSAEQEMLQLPTSSAGYIIDQILHLKGAQKGDAIISNNHAAFIENIGKASASDVIELINLVKQKAKEKLNLDLKTEIEIVGVI